MQPARHLVGLAAAAVLCAGCFKVERRATSSQTVPAGWLGEWRGTWQSSRTTSGGTIGLSIRTFESHPVVSIETTHPCLGAASYRFLLRGNEWQLLADGQRVFAGILDPVARVVAGDYGCPEDEGTWSVAWQRALPPILDFGGDWEGTFANLTQTLVGGLELELDQQWVGGRLVLSGRMRLPALGLDLPVHEGQVIWSGETFQIVLRTDPAAGPSVLLQGLGDATKPEVHDGLLLVEDPRVPFQFGLWSAIWIGP
jgi:hypothetical protein